MLRRPFGTFPSPWREMEHLRREMDRLFTEVPAWAGWDVTPSYPAMNVWTNQEGAMVTAELPGVHAEDIDITVRENVLTISGTRELGEPEEGVTYHRRERGVGQFTRSLQLPFNIEASHVEASFENGVLKIALPRTEAEKPKKIAVKTA
jgi:HSP20 family protein